MHYKYIKFILIHNIAVHLFILAPELGRACISDAVFFPFLAFIHFALAH